MKNKTLIAKSQLKPNRVWHYIFLILFLSLLLSCKEEIVQQEVENRTDLLIIFTTESFISSGLSSIVISEFENQYECTVILRSFNESGALINHLQNANIISDFADRDTLRADIAIGILSPHIYRALQTNLFMPFEPEIVRNINDRTLILDRRHRLLPYSYDFYAFVYDTEIVSEPPKTFGEMQSSIWNDKIIMIDPKTSAIGMGALMWSLGIFGDRGFEQFWMSLKNNIVSISPNLNDAYASFIAGGAPIILSYVSRPAYYREVENIQRFSAFIPQEGRLKEIEFAGILNDAENLFLARRFIEFMLSFDFQSHIPTTMWKYPVIDSVDLPYGLASIQLPVNSYSERVFEQTQFFNSTWADEWSLFMR